MAKTTKKPKRVGFFAEIEETIINKLRAKSEAERRSMASIVESILKKEL